MQIAQHAQDPCAKCCMLTLALFETAWCCMNACINKVCTRLHTRPYAPNHQHALPPLHQRMLNFSNQESSFQLLISYLFFSCFLCTTESFRGRSADFLWMLIFGGVLLTFIAPWVHIQFLGSSLTFMMVYVWGRRHQYINLSFLGVFNFTAPYLPWVLLAFSVMLGSSPVVDLMGMAAGVRRTPPQ